LPEVDGRIFAGVVSFKSQGSRDGDLQFAVASHRADPERVDAAVARIASWHRLATVPAHEKRLAIVLSSYPGRPHQIAHAVGLDALASTEALLGDLSDAGFDVDAAHSLAHALSAGTLTWSLDDYRVALARLPRALRDNLESAWGALEDDSLVR